MAIYSVFTLTSSLRLSSFQRTIKKSFERIAPLKTKQTKIRVTNCFVWLIGPALSLERR